MGILFGGWGREEEEIVRDDYNGDWNKYKEAQKYYRTTLDISPIRFSKTEPKVCRGDMISIWNKEENKAFDQFIVKDIDNSGKILGSYVDSRNHYKTEPWPEEKEYVKLCSVKFEN